jgi:SAM-dependent methyltransferase
MSKKMREKVRRGYENGAYTNTYRKGTKLNQFEKEIFDQLIKLLPQEAMILDLGSGPGIPYDLYLSQEGFRVTGLDFCEQHVTQARRNVPLATYHLCDFTEYDFSQRQYGAILSLYSLFHLPREQHTTLLNRIASALAENGKLLITMGTEDEPYKERKNFCGTEMAWSYFDDKRNVHLLQESGFRVITSFNEQDFGSSEKHLWILAEKI